MQNRCNSLCKGGSRRPIVFREREREKRGGRRTRNLAPFPYCNSPSTPTHRNRDRDRDRDRAPNGVHVDPNPPISFTPSCLEVFQRPATEMACFGYATKAKKKKCEARRGDAPSAGSMSPCKSTASASPRRGIPDLYQEKAHNLRVFGLEELRIATNEFNRMLKIGQGGFGSVYKGFIKPPDGNGDRMAIAIKKLNPKGLQGHKQWLTEVQFLGVVDHPNLVKLLGYCSEDYGREPHRLLVYEFVPNKTLEDHLFNRAYPVLSWNRRLQIALDAAEGLAYLHEGLEVQVIYRDFKASNILLDKEFKPKLSDFGLAREGPEAGHTHVTTAVVGTRGYAAPEYIETGHLTIKSDVWSFGVVLYEILTGRRSLEVNRPKNEQKLLDWVRQFRIDSRRFNMIMDPRLRNEYPLEAAREVAKLASSCIVKNPKARPSMSEISKTLRKALQIH